MLYFLEKLKVSKDSLKIFISTSGKDQLEIILPNSYLIVTISYDCVVSEKRLVA
jgi:hypothetical protein